MSRAGPAAALISMAHFRSLVLCTLMLAPLATGCVVRSHGHGPPAHASGGWRSGGRVPPGQVRRAEVHERNDARKAAHAQGRKRGHGHD